MNTIINFFKSHYLILLKLFTGILFLINIAALYSAYYYKNKYDILRNQQQLVVNFRPTYMMYLKGAEGWAKQEAYCSNTIKDLNQRVHDCVATTAPMVAAMTDYVKNLDNKVDMLKKRCGSQCADIK